MRNAGQKLPTILLIAPDGTIKEKKFAPNVGTNLVEVLTDGRGGYRAMLKSSAREKGWLTLEEGYANSKRKAVRERGMTTYMDWRRACEAGTVGRETVETNDGDRTIKYTRRRPFPREWLPDIVLERKGERTPDVGGWEAPKLKDEINAKRA